MLKFQTNGENALYCTDFIMLFGIFFYTTISYIILIFINVVLDLNLHKTILRNFSLTL